MKWSKYPSLFLALALQVMPLCRVVLTPLLPSAPAAAIILRWLAGAVAVTGACHAVSGASTVITSPTTAKGTNGIAFSYRITTGPEGANQFSAAPLPPGLTVATSSGRITGTPTSNGVWSVLLTASDSGIPSRTVTATLTLTVVAAISASPPTITSQPQSQTVTAGTNVTFTVGASGTAPLSFQWRFGGANISGQTTSALQLASVTTNQSGNYSVVVSNVAGSVVSSTAVLTVNPAPGPPVITGPPQNQMVLAGASASFSVIASGAAPLSYQWRFNGSDLPGQTGTSLQLTSVTTNQAGPYTVVVSNQIAAVTSAPAILTVNLTVVAPAITTPPQNQMVTAGGSAMFSVIASGTAPLSYQWRFGVANLIGHTGSSLQLDNVTTNEAGNYRVVVSNSAGSVTSQVAILTVNQAPIPPSIATQPQSQIAIIGTNVTFSVVATGTAPLTYQWSLGGTNLPAQTDSTLTLNDVTAAQAGAYRVLVGNVAGSVLSDAALLQILDHQPGPPLTLKDVAGHYTGLLYDTNGVALGSSGFFTFTLSSRGTYTATIALSGGWRLSASGTLSSDGTGSNKLNRARSIPVLINWAMDLSGSGQINGTIASESSSWLAELSGARAVFNARTNVCPYEGRYTFIIPGTPGATASPAGDSFGTLVVDKNGIATLKTWLADRSTGAQRVPISAHGNLPLFVPLYSKTGGLLAWINFEDRASDDLHGLLSWIKPASPVADFYPVGFDQTVEMVGSRFALPANSAVLSLTSGIVTLTDGDLPATMTKSIVSTPGQKILGSAPDLLKAAFSTATGIFSGTYSAAGLTRPILLRGIAFQKANYASGFFLGKDQSGRVLIEPVSLAN